MSNNAIQYFLVSAVKKQFNEHEYYMLFIIDNRGNRYNIRCTAEIFDAIVQTVDDISSIMRPTQFTLSAVAEYGKIRVIIDNIII